MSSLTRSVFIVVLVIFCLPTISATDQSSLMGQIRSATLDLDRTVRVENLVLDLGLASMTLKQGVLIPAHPIAGHTAEMLFMGEAVFHIDPPNAIEQQQLELFTGQEVLHETINRAVLVIGDEQITTKLLARDPAEALEPEMATEARKQFQQWVSAPERRGFGADAAVLKASYGDGVYRKYFAAWCHSEQIETFFYQLDPGETEQVALGQFIPLELGDHARHVTDKYIRKQQHRGRLIQLNLEGIGDWDTWISTPLIGHNGKPLKGSKGIEPTHYELDVTVDGPDQKISGHATIEMRVETQDLKVITLRLFPDLKVDEIRDQHGAKLTWFRSKFNIHVVLPEQPEQGASIKLNVDYHGVIFNELEKGIFVLRQTAGWYPRGGLLNRATYDVTFHWPKKYELLASGHRIDGGEESGMNWEQRLLEMPADEFSFEMGAFDLLRASIGHVELTIGFTKASGKIFNDTKEEVIESFKQALGYFEEIYGPYPLDHLTVAVIPRNFSQGYFGFITLAQSLMNNSVRLAYTENLAETIAHELSHQWWGNLVGWETYRDQWLSEALASYSATLFIRHKIAEGALYKHPSQRAWQLPLARTTAAGRTIESMGPVVLGGRLDSSLTSNAYQSVVYGKGEVVFHMLALSVGDEPFLAMLKSLIGAIQNRAINTGTFLQSIEHMSGLDLSSFTEQFIHGTGVPEVYYDYSIQEQEAGGWLIQGQARQLASAHYEYTLARSGEDRWAIHRKRGDQLELIDYGLVVPFIAYLEGNEAVEIKGGKNNWEKRSTERVIGGLLLVQGENSSFQIELAEEPREFTLDPAKEVLAYFFSKNYRPKRVLRFEAMEQTGSQAENSFKRALETPYMSESALKESEASPKKIKRWARLENGSIHLYLTRHYLNEGRIEEARQSLETAETIFSGVDNQRYRHLRKALNCRLELIDGDFKAAYKDLSNRLRLDFPQRHDDSTVEQIRRMNFSEGRWGDGEDYAMLAVSAYETGHEVVARKALETAQERGADMTALLALLTPQ